MWHRDERVEQLLKRLGIAFEYRTGIPISSVKVKESKQINARCGDGADDQRVAEYAYKMKQGARFPAPVLTKDLLIAAGVHRISAAQVNDFGKIDAYIIVANQQQLDEFTRLDNTGHGKGLDEQQKLVTCVEQHLKYGKSIKDLNDDYFAGNEKTYSLICVAVRAKRVEEKLLSKGVPTTGLNNSVLASMHVIADNHTVLKSVGSLASEYRLTTAQVDELVRTLHTKPDERERLKVISEHRAALLEKTTKGKGGIAIEVLFKRELEKFAKFLEAGNDGAVFPIIESMFVGEDCRTMKAKLNDIINGLKRLKEKGTK